MLEVEKEKKRKPVLNDLDMMSSFLQASKITKCLWVVKRLVRQNTCILECTRYLFQGFVKYSNRRNCPAHIDPISLLKIEMKCFHLL